MPPSASRRCSSSVSGCADSRSGRRARVSRSGLAPAPALDRRVVAREQHGGDRLAVPGRRAASTAGTRGARPRTTRRRRTGRSRARPGTRRATASTTTAAASSPAREHEVADAAAPRRTSDADALVDAFVAPADEREARLARASARARRLIERPPARREQDAVRGAARRRDGLERRGDRLDAHDHPGAAAVGRVVDLAVLPGREVARVRAVDGDDPGGDGLAEHASRASNPSNISGNSVTSSNVMRGGFACVRRRSSSPSSSSQRTRIFGRARRRSATNSGPAGSSRSPPSASTTVRTSWAPFQNVPRRRPSGAAVLVVDGAAEEVLDVVLARLERRQRCARHAHLGQGERGGRIAIVDARETRRGSRRRPGRSAVTS